MYSQEKEDATQRKTLKHAGYRSKEKRSSVDASSQHPNLHKQNTTKSNIIPSKHNARQKGYDCLKYKELILFPSKNTKKINCSHRESNREKNNGPEQGKVT